MPGMRISTLAKKLGIKSREVSFLLMRDYGVDVVGPDDIIEEPLASAFLKKVSMERDAIRRSKWLDLARRLPVGTRITGKVRNVLDFGAFVEVEDGVDGLIHVSDMAWKRVNASEVLRKGDVLEAVVLSVDPARFRLSLGLKQLETDSVDKFFAGARVGAIVKGQVTRVLDFGAFVELSEEIEGLIHVSQFGERPPDVGGYYELRIVKLNHSEKKIGLSIVRGIPGTDRVDH